MVRKAALIVGLSLWATQASADSTTNCRRTLMGHMDCTTTDTTPDNRALNDGISSLTNAIAARAARKREDRAVQPEPDVADLTTGNGFLAGCAPQPKSMINTGLCYGFIRGLLHREWMNGTNAAICLPEGVNFAQMNAVIADFITNNPQDRHRPLGVLTYVALSKSFPCATPKPSAPAESPAQEK